MTGLTIMVAAEDIAQREQRRRALLNHAAECERAAWDCPTQARAAELYDDAKHARLAAQALAVDA